MTPPTHGAAEDSARLKTPPTPTVAPGTKSTVSRLISNRGPCRELARYRAPPSVLTTAKPFLYR